MSPNPRARRPAAPVAALAAVILALGTVVVSTATRFAAPAGAETVALPAGSVTVELRGNGHGHGLSQYGARGAAIAGLSATQILAYYYPGTSLVTLRSSSIRVLISGTGATTTVSPQAGLFVTGVSGALPTVGISRYRLAPSGAGLALQKLTTAGWSTVKTGLPSGASFSRSSGNVRVYRTDGSSTAYRGAATAVRSGAGVITVNRVSLDGYTAGVVPREIPASWQTTAVHAQAVAARSYGRNAVENTAGGAYDICDTTQCQVYGGMTRYDASGHVVYTEDLAAISGNANMVLRYGGATIFAQFSASNGGWSVAGGRPYLVARADKYDNVGSGDPYLSYTRSVPTASIAQHYGLASVSSIEITRDGHGTWGGRMTSGFVNGRDARGTTRRIATTGLGLQAGMGVGTRWFSIQASARPVGHLDGFAPAAPRTLQINGWTFDPDHRDLPGKFVLTLDHIARPAQVTTTTRADVQRAYGTTTSTLGFSVRVRVGVGQHTACLYGLDRDGLGQRVIGCKSALMPNVLGSLESVTSTDLHTMRVVGWTFDSSNGASPGRFLVKVDGTATGLSEPTTLARPDVRRAYGTAGQTFGYDKAVTLTGGAHQVCVLGVDLARRGAVPLGCRAVSVAQNPLGRAEVMQHVAGGYQISGWTFDPDRNGGSTAIRVYVDHVLVATVSAGATRLDVQRAYHLSNSAVGFSRLVPASSAKHTITITSVNTGLGADTVLVSGWA